MDQLYISRSLEPVLKRAVAEFPAVVLTGPRQSGKTTLLKHLFGPQYRTGLKTPEHAAGGPMGGAIMETAVLSEIVKTITHQGLEPEIYFWRTSAGAEVDFVVSAEGKLVPIEVKLSATPRPAMAKSIRSFQEGFGDLSTPGYVLHSGSEHPPIAPKVAALPFGAL